MDESLIMADLNEVGTLPVERRMGRGKNVNSEKGKFLFVKQFEGGAGGWLVLISEQDLLFQIQRRVKADNERAELLMDVGHFCIENDVRESQY